MKNFLGLTGLMALATASAFAAPMCSTTAAATTPPGNNIIAGAPNTITPPPDSSDTYAPCSVGPLTFQNVSYDLDMGSFSSGTPDVAMTAIAMVGSEVQMSFNPNLTAGSDLDLEFQMVGGIQGVDLGFDGTGTGFVNEVVCSVFISGTTNCPTGDVLAILNVSAGNTSASATFAAQPEVWVFKDISSGTAPFSQVDQSYMVPEPATLSLMGASLLGLGLLGRRRLRK